MTQKSLLPADAEFVGTAAAAPVEQLPAIREAPVDPAPRGSALATLRDNAMSVPVEQMQIGLAEFADRRKCFRDWILSQMVEGLHFGFPPGCEPKWVDARNQAVRSQAEAVGTWGKDGTIPFSSWLPKKSLYEAGADFVCEVAGIRAHTYPSNDGWIQAGSIPNNFVVNCDLISRTTKEVLANGLGAQTTEKEQTKTANAALKKAAKRATVAAVLNWLGLRDLFAEQLDPEKALHENPTAAVDAPRAHPRADRVTTEQIIPLVERWKSVRPPEDRKKIELWAAFVHKATGREFDVKKPDEWHRADLAAVDKSLTEEGI